MLMSDGSLKSMQQYISNSACDNTFQHKKFSGEARAPLALAPYYHYRVSGLLAPYYQCRSWPTNPAEDHCTMPTSRKGGTTYKVTSIYKNSLG
jgi:hypothetical protein